jgi:hypothetical protein
MGFSFVADMITSHLLIVPYFTSLFTSVTGSSNQEQGSLEQCKISTMDLYILFYSIPGLPALVTHHK